MANADGTAYGTLIGNDQFIVGATDAGLYAAADPGETITVDSQGSAPAEVGKVQSHHCLVLILGFVAVGLVLSHSLGFRQIHAA